MAKKGKGKGALANALARQQNEERQRKIKKQKLDNKEKHYPEKGKSGNKNKNKQKPIDNFDPMEDEKPIDEKNVFIPFNKKDRILIIGDGDFSYTISIVSKGLIKPKKVIATSFDTFEELIEKYGNNTIEENLEKLKKLGVEKIYHGIDGTKLCESFGISKNSKKSKRSGDGSGKSIEVFGGLIINNILFNFPHIGKHISDVERNILKNQEMVNDFFKSCTELFAVLRRQRESRGGVLGYKEDDKDNSDDGDNEEEEIDEYGYFSNLKKTEREIRDEDCITITLFSGEPYDSWKIKKLARDSIGYSVQRSGKLEWKFFDGYTHRRTAGVGETNKKFSLREARIYKFEKFKSSSKVGKKRKRGNDEDSDSGN